MYGPGGTRVTIWVCACRTYVHPVRRVRTDVLPCTSNVIYAYILHQNPQQHRKRVQVHGLTTHSDSSPSLRSILIHYELCWQSVCALMDGEFVILPVPTQCLHPLVMSFTRCSFSKPTIQAVPSFFVLVSCCFLPSFPFSFRPLPSVTLPLTFLL